LNCKIDRINQELEILQRLKNNTFVKNKIVGTHTYVNDVIPLNIAQDRIKNILGPIMDLNKELMVLKSQLKDIDKQIKTANEEINSMNLKTNESTTNETMRKEKKKSDY